MAERRDQFTGPEWIDNDPNAFPLAPLKTEVGFKAFFQSPESPDYVGAEIAISPDLDFAANAETELAEMWDEKKLRWYGNRVLSNAYAYEEVLERTRRDPLTGLLNQVAWKKTLRQCIESAETTGERVVVVLFDLDAFKEANYTLTHSVADGILKQVAQVLLKGVRNGQHLSGRLGGDEFGIILTFPASDADISLPKQRDVPEGGKMAQGLDNAVSRVMNKLVENINDQLAAWGISRLRITAGAASSEAGMNMQDLLHIADTNVGKAKDEGKILDRRTATRARVKQYMEGRNLIAMSGVVWVDPRFLPEIELPPEDEEAEN